MSIDSLSHKCNFPCTLFFESQTQFLLPTDNIFNVITGCGIVNYSIIRMRNLDLALCF